MRKLVNLLTISLILLGCSSNAFADWRFYNSNVYHRSQPTNWSCGPTTVAMWAGSIRRQSLDIYQIANQCCGSDGTILPEFLGGMYNWTPYGYVFSEWHYVDPEAAVKGVMWSVARFGEPATVVGANGMHYVLVRGGRSDSNPYNYYSENNHIRGVYVNDSTQGSPYYSSPVSGMYKDIEYSPGSLMLYWRPIKPWWKFWTAPKYISIERECYACWGQQGQTYQNNDRFNSY